MRIRENDLRDQNTNAKRPMESNSEVSYILNHGQRPGLSRILTFQNYACLFNVCAVPTKILSITRNGCETETNYWKYVRRLLCERSKLLCSHFMSLRVLWSRLQNQTSTYDDSIDVYINFTSASSLLHHTASHIFLKSIPFPPMVWGLLSKNGTCSHRWDPAPAPRTLETNKMDPRHGGTLQILCRG